MSWLLTMSSSRCMGPGAGCTSLEPPVYKCRERIWAGVPSAHTWPGPSFGGEHRPFEWGWRAVRLCFPCLRWWGVAVPAAVCRWGLCPHCHGAGKCLLGAYLSSSRRSARVRKEAVRPLAPAQHRQIYRRGFRDLEFCVISALGYAQIWGKR